MRRRIGLLAVGAVLFCGVRAATAFHTLFSYRVDRFEADGNVLGPLDGVPDVVDEFDAAPLGPLWYQAYGTVVDGTGYLILTNPGVHFPAPPDPSSPSGALLDLSIAASSSPTWVYDGMGDFVGTAYWEGVIPAIGHHYHFSLYTFGGLSGLYAETFGIAIRRTDTKVEIEQHLTEIDQYSGTFQNTQLLFHEIDPADLTGRLVFRIMFHDATNEATTAFSLDGGTTWESPFPPGLIFQGRTQAQFLLSADPWAGPVGNVTTTTVSSSTTTTTLPGGPCVVTGCRQSTQMLKSKLVIKNKGNPAAAALLWKWKKGELTTFPEFGNPAVANGTNYWFCLGDATGSVYDLPLPVAGGWTNGTQGFTYTDYGGVSGGIRKVMLRRGEQGKASIQLKVQGVNATLPDLPLQLPITARLSNSLGECWAEEFDATGLRVNSDTQFSGKSH